MRSGARFFFLGFEESLSEKILAYFTGVCMDIWTLSRILEYLVLLLEGSDLGSNSGSTFLLGELLLSVLLRLSSVLLLGELLLGWLELRVLSDGLVGGSVELLDSLAVQVLVNVVLEEQRVSLLIIVSKLLHVVGNVVGEDVGSQEIRVKLLGLDIPTRESGWRVRNVETTVGGTLKGTKHSGTSSGSLKTNVQVDLEWSWGIVNGLSELELTFNLLNTSVGLLEAELVKSSSGNEKSGSVGSGPVGQTVLDSELRQLVGVSRSEHDISLESGRDDLADDVLVGESDDQSELWRVVLGLVLSDKSLSGKVVSLAFSSSSEGGLVTRKVRGFSLWNESHGCSDEGIK